MKLEIDWLRENCQKIHSFGLVKGMIQLKLDDYTRLHFYKPSAGSYNVVSDKEYHNHRYDFISHVLKGSLRNELACKYRCLDESSPRYVIHKVSCDPDKKVELDENYLAPHHAIITWVNKPRIKAGESYEMLHHRYHKVHVEEDTITYLLKTCYKKEHAEVLRREGVTEVCPFSSPLTETECWDIVRSMV